AAIGDVVVAAVADVRLCLNRGRGVAVRAGAVRRVGRGVDVEDGDSGTFPCGVRDRDLEVVGAAEVEQPKSQEGEQWQYHGHLEERLPSAAPPATCFHGFVTGRGSC